MRIGDLPVSADVTEIRVDAGQRIRPELASRYGIERAREAAHLLAARKAVADVVSSPGYFDQSHLARALRRYVGRTAVAGGSARAADAAGWDGNAA
jgi:methylphosphotriester-DNA--protein-cysteine methyltransferase